MGIWGAQTAGSVLVQVGYDDALGKTKPVLQVVVVVLIKYAVYCDL